MASRHRLTGLLAALLLFGTSATAMAHTPTAGSQVQYNQGTTLFWRFEENTTFPNVAWPSYAKTAVRGALGTAWSDTGFNASQMPDYTESSTGAGDLWWRAATLSPCSGQAGWIGCNAPHATGATAWDIYVRDFTNAPLGNSHWDEHPSATGTLYRMERVSLHEGFHNVLDVPNHDNQSWVYTLMQAVTPSQGQDGWDTNRIRRCDEAAAQREYDVQVLANRYADCFDHIPNADPDGNGLKTNLSIDTDTTTRCNGSHALLSGTLTVGNDTTNYEELSGNPLGNRTVLLQRKPVSGGVWGTIATLTSHSSLGTYSKLWASSSAGSWLFRAEFPEDDGNQGNGLAGRLSSQTVQVTWIAC